MQFLIKCYIKSKKSFVEVCSIVVKLYMSFVVLLLHFAITCISNKIENSQRIRVNYKIPIRYPKQLFFKNKAIDTKVLP